MNGIALPLFAGMVAALVLAGAGCADAQEPVRVMSYNIHHGEGTDGEFDLERLAGVIESTDPDLVALQEVDVETERSSGVDQAERLGELTGMEVVFGRTQDYRGGEFGNAILTRLPVLRPQNEALPSTPSTDEKTHYPRGAVAVDVKGPGGRRLRFISTHFQHNLKADRVAQAERINELFASGEDDPPTILAGDLNALPDSEPMRILLRRWADAAADDPRPTVPVNDPARRIDYVLHRPADRWSVTETRVLDEPVASDHLPVAAELRLRSAGSATDPEQEAADREMYRQIRDNQRRLRSTQP